MWTATLSIRGLYIYDPTVFDYMVLPSELDRQDVIDSIIMECSELELLYPSITTMKQYIGTWSRKNLRSWQKLYETTVLEYNPIENYDRHEEWEDSGESSKTGKRDATSSDSSTSVMESDNGSISDFQRRGSNSDHEKKTAFNTNTLLPTSDIEHAYGEGSHETVDGDYNSNTTNTGTSQYGETSSDGEKEKRTHKGYIHGNIGVTSSQQMITQQREIVMFNVIDVIVHSFKMEFCLPLY